MKVKFLILSVVASLLFVSCSNSDDLVYSCDKQTDLWVKENIEMVRSFGRNEWLKFSNTEKRAIYRAFTPEQRVLLWKEKLNEVKKLSWNEKELSHITKIEEFIDMHKEYFESGLSDDGKDVVDTFFYKWKTYAVDSLGWDKRICIAIAGTPDRMGKSGELIVNDSSVQKERRKDCNCNLKQDFCDVTGGGSECRDEPCEADDWGCGWVWLNDCDGLCSF